MAPSADDGEEGDQGQGRTSLSCSSDSVLSNNYRANPEGAYGHPSPPLTISSFCLPTLGTSSSDLLLHASLLPSFIPSLMANDGLGMPSSPNLTHGRRRLSSWLHIDLLFFVIHLPLTYEVHMPNLS